ncbi:MAG: hypothetical protein J7M24_05780 [Candidatus Latescibacteria bacterium]|nr:hypothetical protein [Candidatus Latescibacterota bacterium]
MGRMTGRLCALATGVIAGRVTDASTGVYVWDVPDLPTPQCRIRISDAGSGGLADISDGAFSNSSK